MDQDIPKDQVENSVKTNPSSDTQKDSAAVSKPSDGENGLADNQTQRTRSPDVAIYRLHKDPVTLILLHWMICIGLVLGARYILLYALEFGASFIGSSGATDSFRLLTYASNASDREFWQHTIFLIFLSLFLGMWWVYFSSKLQNKEKQGGPRDPLDINPDLNYCYAVQSLRRYLALNTLSWSRQHKTMDNDDGEKPQAALRRKASASMEVAAIFIVADLLLLEEASSLLREYNQLSIFTYWDVFILGATMIFTVISMVCFIVSIDALDVIFNKFSSPHGRTVSLNYFYQRTINHRYYALISLMFAIVFFLATVSTAIATSSIILICYFGYCLWFPDIESKSAAFGGDERPSDAYDFLDSEFRDRISFPVRKKISRRHLSAFLFIQFLLYLVIEVSEVVSA